MLIEDEDVGYETQRQRRLDAGSWGAMLGMLIPKPPLTHQPTRNTQKKLYKVDCTTANATKIAKAAERYKAAFVTEWNTTGKIEARLGMTPSTAYKTLVTYLERGWVARRPVGEHYNRRKGWEWKWVKV
jgi:hypothetical protein